MSEPRQLELDLATAGAPAAGSPRRPSRGELAAAGRQLVRWLPVLALLAVFAQVAWLGLRPARHEAERLRRAEVVVSAREERLAAHNARLARELRALSDPIFEERVARARRSRAFPALPRPLDLLRPDAR